MNELDIEDELNSGKYLFKFCRFNTNALQILINKTLYFCPPNKLNDPLDSQFNLKINKLNNFSQKTRESILSSRFFLSEKIKFLIKDIGLDLGKESSHESFFTEYFTHLQNDYHGICCFSQTHSDNLLWTHYSDEAKGICLVFDRALLITALKNNLNSGSYHLYHGSTTYRGIKKLESTLCKDGRLKWTLNHLFSKTKHWKYEKEYRLILSQLPRHSLELIPVNFNPFLKIDDTCLKFVIMGQRISNENKNMLRNLKEKNVMNAILLDHKFDKK